MKSILLSIKPEQVAKILNGEKTVEIKQFPKDYVGWVYLYCTKGKPLIYYVDDEVGCVEKVNGEFAFRTSKNPSALNGKVVARFYCDKVYKSLIKNSSWGGKLIEQHIEYFVHISKLEVFDEPRELGEFNRKIVVQYQKPWGELCSYLEPLTKAPRNYCYIENE